VDAITLEALQKLNAPVMEQRAPAGDGRKTGDRYEAVRDAAFGVGARGGLVAETSVINAALEQMKRKMDTIYDFQPLMIQNRVIPPVLTTARDIYTQGDVVTLRLAGVSYNVESQAHFASRPPNWREYLMMEVGELAMPSAGLLPRTDEERNLWIKGVADGWVSGIKQADEMFDTNLNRLNRDYVGMTRYHVLALKNMVTIPVVAQQSMPINTSGNSMSLDETLLRITALPQFNTNMKGWSSLGGEVTPVHPVESQRGDAK